MPHALIQKTPTTNANVSDWLNYMQSIHTSAIDMGLARVLPVFKKLAIQKKATVFTVAGTNGKGSTTATISEICIQAGYKTALYQSPHLVSFNERIKINGKSIDDTSLVRAFAKVEQARVACAVSLSFFEMTTLSAFVIFDELDCDVWVLEIGLGGRLDVVNLIDPDVAVITNVALDHTDWLGDDVQKIGREKAGIIRPNIPVVFGSDYLPSVVHSLALDNNCVIYEFNRDYNFYENTDSFVYSSSAHTLKLPIPKLALQNVACAISAVLASGLSVCQDDLVCAMTCVGLAGRLDLRVIDNRHWLFDVAHNVAGVQFLLSQFTKIWQNFIKQHQTAKLYLVFGMLADKDTKGVIDELSNANLPITHIYTATLDNPRTMTGVNLKQQIHSIISVPTTAFEHIDQAIQQVKTDSQSNDFVLVIGSFHTIGESLVALKQYNGFEPV